MPRFHDMQPMASVTVSSQLPRMIPRIRSVSHQSKGFQIIKNVLSPHLCTARFPNLQQNVPDQHSYIEEKGQIKDQRQVTAERDRIFTFARSDTP